MGLIFDTEALQSKGSSSWGEYREIAGISLACTINTDNGIPVFYSNDDEDSTGHSIKDFARDLEEADFIVGYNSEWYDIPVLEATLGRGVNPKQHIDFYLRIKDALNGERWGKGAWKLDRVGMDTIGIGKTSVAGAFAPSLWRDRRFGELFTYCYRDVWVLWKLYEHVKCDGWVVDPEGGKLYVDVGR